MADKVMGRGTCSASQIEHIDDFVRGMRESAGESSKAIVNALLAGAAVSVYMASR